MIQKANHLRKEGKWAVLCHQTLSCLIRLVQRYLAVFLCYKYHCFNVSSICVVLLSSVTGIVVLVNKICFIYKIFPFQCTKSYSLTVMFDLSLFYVPKHVVLCTKICFYNVPNIDVSCA